MMKPVFLSALIAMSAAPCACASPIAVSGDGVASCAAWTARHQQYHDPSGIPQDDWLFGYITAVNQFAPDSNNGNIQGSSDDDALVAWVSTYCAREPLDTVARSAGMLVLELRRRATGK